MFIPTSLCGWFKLTITLTLGVLLVKASDHPPTFRSCTIQYDPSVLRQLWREWTTWPRNRRVLEKVGNSLDEILQEKDAELKSGMKNKRREGWKCARVDEMLVPMHYKICVGTRREDYGHEKIPVLSPMPPPSHNIFYWN